MKPSKVYFDKIPWFFENLNLQEWICDQIEQAQKEAYNQAIEDSNQLLWSLSDADYMYISKYMLKLKKQ